MAYRRRWHPLFALSMLVIALVALVAVAWLVSHRRDPSRLDQKSLHLIGTQAQDGRMQPLPRLHRVVITALTGSDVAKAVFDYLPLPARGGHDLELQGYYDPRSRRIHVVGVLPRIEASIADSRLQGQFLHAIRHEYGHAFLDDWTRSQDRSADYSPAFTHGQDTIRESELPNRLGAVVHEYKTVADDVYGSTYFVSNFNEYMAEGYARFLEGRFVPPAAREFFTQGLAR